MSSGNSVYERDFYTWALEQARALQERRVDALDWENLADEVGDLARERSAHTQKPARKTFDALAEVAVAGSAANAFPI